MSFMSLFFFIFILWEALVSQRGVIAVWYGRMCLE